MRMRVIGIRCVGEGVTADAAFYSVFYRYIRFCACLSDRRDSGQYSNGTHADQKRQAVYTYSFGSYSRGFCRARAHRSIVLLGRGFHAMARQTVFPDGDSFCRYTVYGIVLPCEIAAAFHRSRDTFVRVACGGHLRRAVRVPYGSAYGAHPGLESGIQLDKSYHGERARAL